MPKLVTKFKYLNPNARQSRGGYAKYIATREGVEKLDDSQKFAPTTAKQRQLIDKLLHDFPDSKEMFEYDDYLQKQTAGSASEFISRTLEDNAGQVMTSKTYADYIATRPRAERFGSHGLFTDDGVQVNLQKVSAELNDYTGNVYTIIISLHREDAARLGFDTGSRWRDMLRTQTQALAENLKIPMEHLKWFAAFHNESHHPHVHLIAYSTVPNEGYLSKQGVHNLRSEFAKDIFAQDLHCIYEQQTEYRDELRLRSKERIAEIVEQINSGLTHDPQLQQMLLSLADRLKKHKGKKVYIGFDAVSSSFHLRKHDTFHQFPVEVCEVLAYRPSTEDTGVSLYISLILAEAVTSSSISSSDAGIGVLSDPSFAMGGIYFSSPVSIS